MNFTLKLLSATLLLASSVMAQKPETVELWPQNQIPNAIPNEAVQEKSEMGKDGILRISDVKVPTITAFLPPKDKATGAAIMVIPGGGYSLLAYGHEGEEMAQWFNERGIAAFVLKHRLPDDRTQTNRHEVPLADAMQGMKLIRQNAAKWNINADRLGVIGFSAGGHLASTLSTHYHRGAAASEEAKPNFAILMYPVVTFGAKAHGGSRDKLIGKNASPEQIAYYSNELQVDAKTPPTFLVHAQDDKGVPVENSIDYYLALTKANVPAEMHLYPKGGHGYALRVKGKGSIENWPAACEGWLKSMGLLDKK
ncbi:alpha/beta hydrolase [Larkinella terrae]|uniref:Prolyl oligopeptidase family serine peptidase n=1 Tax=Larkinella terrae TaxID=2025311 RepID=A0A7K0EJB3_9BACT|nr:alpha/beta hydrolase [Larkinella terrae]MRS61538.1 prolyl oligopeptidase family serine peptidase [Larkinella terrae]